MPEAEPPEFRRRAVELARQRDMPIARGCSTDERAQLVRLRRKLRVAQKEIEILKRAQVNFAPENVLPKWASGWSETSPRTPTCASMSRWPAGC